MDSTIASKLFALVQVGPMALSHRVVHAPMTRLRSEPDDSPSAMMVEYYRQRASQGGLLITGSAHPSHNSRGYIGAPGIHTEAHIAAWKKVTDAMHEKGAFDREGAEQIIQRGDADRVAFGRWFSSNPDLPERFRLGLPLAGNNRDAFWGGHERGYIDFPSIKHSAA